MIFRNIFNYSPKPTYILFSVLLTLGCAYQANAAVLEIDTFGNLTGASGVSIAGSLYNVSFQDGSYEQVFGTTPLLFNTKTKVDLASHALLNQVLIDVNQNNFDSNPRGTVGCSNGTLCKIETPYAFVTINGSISILTGFASNNVNATLDSIGESEWNESYNSTAHSQNSWASWSAVQAVPEPSTYAMMAIGLLGLAGMRHRQHKA